MVLPLRGRLTLVYSIAFAVLLAIGGTVLYVLVARSYAQEIDRELYDTERAARGLFADDLGENGTAKATIAHLVSELIFGDRSLLAMDSVGNRFAVGKTYPGVPSLRTLDPHTVADRPTTVELERQPVRILRIHFPDGMSLIVGHSLQPLDARLMRLRVALGAGSLLILVAGGLGGWLASRLALRPIIEVAADAERLGVSVDAGAASFGRLAERVPSDEVSTVAAAFNRSIAALERALGRERAIGDRQRAFLANAAHELRTPVAILQSEAEASLSSGDVAEHRRALVAIADESRELGALVGDLLLLARGESPSEHTHQRLWLDDIAARVAARARSLPAAQDRTIRIGSFEAAPTVGDAQLIERSLLALVHNALVHAAPSPIELSSGVTPANATQAAQAWVRVRDWGPGIPAQDQARIFERFERLAQDRPGTGLGLAIARAAAEAAGATITLESSPGEGSTFTLTAPASGGSG